MIERREAVRRAGVEELLRGRDADAPRHLRKITETL